MNFLYWNCRGLGNTRIVCELHLLVKEKTPKVVFIYETKCNRERVEKVRNCLGYANSFVVDSLRKSGGLAMLWGLDTRAELCSYSRHHISLVITNENEDRQWHLIGFYGDPVVEKRKDGIFETLKT